MAFGFPYVHNLFLTDGFAFKTLAQEKICPIKTYIFTNVLFGKLMVTYKLHFILIDVFLISLLNELT